MTVVVVLLMAIGTGYDIYITRKYTRGRKVIYDLERHAKLDQLTGRSQKSLNTGKIIFLFERPSCNVPFLGAASRKRNISLMLVNKKVTNTYRRSQDKDSSKDSLIIIFRSFSR